jgi:hypothetical protein
MPASRLILLSIGFTRAGRDVEGHAQHDHAIKKALEHRRHAEAPDRELHDQRFRGLQAPHIIFEAALVAACIMIMPPGLLRKHRIEALRIKVEKVDVVARSLQTVKRLGPNSRVKTLGQRMAKDIKYPHLVGLGANSQHANQEHRARQRQRVPR